jgi:hypothetical protein
LMFLRDPATVNAMTAICAGRSPSFF